MINMCITEFNSMKSDQLVSNISVQRLFQPQNIKHCDIQFTDLGYFNEKKKMHGNHEIMWTFCTTMINVIPYPVSFQILYWKANIVSCHVLCVKYNGHVLFAMKRVNN